MGYIQDVCRENIALQFNKCIAGIQSYIQENGKRQQNTLHTYKFNIFKELLIKHYL